MESDDENNTNENNNNNLSDKKKKEDKKENILNIKKKAEEIINENLKIGKSNELLPKIPLFNQNEKKILLNILPEKEIEKFEKRYECIDNAKNNLKRKYALETKLLNKENKDLENKYEISLLQLKENEQKNKNLLIQINEQKKEIVYIKN
jgi:cellobiose-specific phosphotransferase system component IIA